MMERVTGSASGSQHAERRAGRQRDHEPRPARSRPTSPTCGPPTSPSCCGTSACNAPCSRADIAASTGLNKATVSSLVAELIDRRLLRETGLTEHRIGRPATMLVLDGAPYAAIGLEVSTDHLDRGRDRPGRRAAAVLAARLRRAGPPARPRPSPRSPRWPGGRVAEVPSEGREVLGLTVGVPGLVDADGVVRLAPNLGWRDVALRDDAARRRWATRTSRSTVDNDANLAVAGRAPLRRRTPARPNLVYLTGEVGVGAGIIADGRLLRGGRGYSGEIGHLPVDPAGPLCALRAARLPGGGRRHRRAGRPALGRRRRRRPTWSRRSTRSCAGPAAGDRAVARRAGRRRRPARPRRLDAGQPAQPRGGRPRRLLRAARALAAARGRGGAARRHRRPGRRRLPARRRPTLGQAPPPSAAPPRPRRRRLGHSRRVTPEAPPRQLDRASVD